MGGKIVDDIDKEFDIMVVGGKLVRNAKLLCAITRRVSVVNFHWLEDSKAKGEFLKDTNKYLVLDK